MKLALITLACSAGMVAAMLALNGWVRFCLWISGDRPWGAGLCIAPFVLAGGYAVARAVLA